MENFKANRKGLNRQNQKMTLKPGKTFCQFKVTSFIVITMNPRVQLYVRHLQKETKKSIPSFKKLTRRVVNLYRKIMNITSQLKGTLRDDTTTWFTSLFLCLKRRKFRMRKQQWTRNGRSSNRFHPGSWTKQNGGYSGSTRQRKGHLLYCCNQVWMKKGGRILWSVTAICETFQISCLMGKHPNEQRFGEPFEGPIIPFGSMVEYHPISAKDLSRLHQFGKKVLPWIFLGYVWKRDILVADIEELERMDASETHARRLNAKEVITLPKWWFFEKKNPDCRFWEHLPQHGTALNEVKNVNIFEENQTGLHRRKTHCRVTVKHGTTSCQLPETTFTVITLNQESNFTCREKSNSHFHFDVLTWPGPQVRLWMWCWEAAWIIVGTLKETKIHRMRGRASHNSQYWMKKRPDGFSWPGERLTKKQTTSRPDHLWPEMWKKTVRCSGTKRKTKVGYRETKARHCKKAESNYFWWSDRSWVEGHHEETVGKGWKFRRQQPKIVKSKHGETCSSSCIRKTKYAHEDHVAGKRINSLNHYNLVHKFIPMPDAMNISRRKSSSGKIMGKHENIPAWQLTRVRNKKDVIDEATKEGKPYILLH